MPSELPPQTMITPDVAAFIMRKIPPLDWKRAVEGARGIDPSFARRMATQALYLRQGAAFHARDVERTASVHGSTEAPEESSEADLSRPDDSLDTAAVSERLGVSDRTVRTLCATEALRAHRVGPVWAIDPKSVDEYEKARTA